MPKKKRTGINKTYKTYNIGSIDSNRTNSRSDRQKNEVSELLHRQLDDDRKMSAPGAEPDDIDIDGPSHSLGDIVSSLRKKKNIASSTNSRDKNNDSLKNIVDTLRTKKGGNQKTKKVTVDVSHESVSPSSDRDEPDKTSQEKADIDTDREEKERKRKEEVEYKRKERQKEQERKKKELEKEKERKKRELEKEKERKRKELEKEREHRREEEEKKQQEKENKRKIQEEKRKKDEEKKQEKELKKKQQEEERKEEEEHKRKKEEEKGADEKKERAKRIAEAGSSVSEYLTSDKDNVTDDNKGLSEAENRKERKKLSPTERKARIKRANRKKSIGNETEEFDEDSYNTDADKKDRYSTKRRPRVSRRDTSSEYGSPRNENTSRYRKSKDSTVSDGSEEEHRYSRNRNKYLSEERKRSRQSRPRVRRQEYDSDSEDNRKKIPLTEDELIDKYRDQLQQIARKYPNFKIQIPDKATSRRYQSMCMRAMERLAVEEEVSKYVIGMVVVMVIIQWVGCAIGLPLQDYVEIQMASIGRYTSLLIELGDKDYLGFARSWPVELRLFGLMLLNAFILVVVRLMMEPDYVKRFFARFNRIGDPRYVGFYEDTQLPADKPGGIAGLIGSIAGMFGGGGGAAATGGGGVGGLGSLLGGLMGAMGGGGGGGGANTSAPPPDRKSQTVPRYKRKTDA